jgi:hypothetical protein
VVPMSMEKKKSGEGAKKKQRKGMSTKRESL